MFSFCTCYLSVLSDLYCKLSARNKENCACLFGCLVWDCLFEKERDFSAYVEETYLTTTRLQKEQLSITVLEMAK